ncbi:hypothetical protein FQA39_LY17637 [Lamprigera yunnana]|nr:hypothetical protein FQA39_LY17637 [Lamprigera yunnana]
MPDYNPAEEARLLQYNKASNEVLVDVTRYALDDNVDKYIEMGYSTYLNLEPVIRIRDASGDFGSGGCQALLNKNSVLLTDEEWKTLMGLESYMANQFFLDSIEIQHILEQSFKDDLSVRNISRTVDSLATSCIQLAKERIIKYSDTKYNINDFKTGDCETMLFNQRIYYLNKSKKIQFIKKMWMLYAKQHWTKEIDSKSAVERLYEKLGALELDADHKAIYGMEKYYTVEQCKNLRDKYKIGRKVCRQFLKGKTCSQCLVKRINDIGLQHFLDTISKYIKDCSDSDTSSYSSDEEECKEAVKQDRDDSKTTEEEESKKSEGGRNTKPFS